MSRSSLPGFRHEAPSHLGGLGWRPRTLSHREEMGALWTASGLSSPVAPLQEVVLALPGLEQRYPEDPALWLMEERPELDRMRGEFEGLVKAYQAEGVVVQVHRPRQPTPNHIFCCDLFFATPEGIILSRMASEQRAGEEREIAAFFARMGVPILLTPRGHATFEGADAMWLDARTVLIGIGNRTNEAAVAQLRPLLESMGVEVRVCTLTSGVQHLLGAFNPVDERVACVLADELSPSLRRALSGWRLILLPSTPETRRGRAMNFVTLSPRRVLMPAGSPNTRALYESQGITVIEAPIDQYLRAAGGMGCLTGVLRRG